MPKCNFCISVFSCKFLHIFRTPFPKNTSGRLLVTSNFISTNERFSIKILPSIFSKFHYSSMQKSTNFSLDKPPRWSYTSTCIYMIYKCIMQYLISYYMIWYFIVSYYFILNYILYCTYKCIYVERRGRYIDIYRYIYSEI